MGGTSAMSMRSAEHNNNDGKSSTMGFPGAMASLVGGKRRRTKKARKTKRSKRSRSGRSKRVKRGGMGAGLGFGAALKEAIVPFGIFAMQKRRQRRSSGKKSFRKNRSNRRRSNRRR